MTGIIFDPLTVAHLFHHLDVKSRPLFQALSLQQFILGTQFIEPDSQLLPDVDNRPLQIVLCRYIVTAGINGYLSYTIKFFTAQGIHQGNGFNQITEELHPDGLLFLIGGKDLDNVAPDPEGSPMKIDVVAFVLYLHKSPEHLIARNFFAFFQQEQHTIVSLRGAKTIDAGNTGHDNDITALKQGMGRRMAQLVNLFIDG